MFDRDGKRLVGYWIGREFWGKGLATKALAELLAEVTARPLHAYVATTQSRLDQGAREVRVHVREPRDRVRRGLGEEIEEALYVLEA